MSRGWDQACSGKIQQYILLTYGGNWDEQRLLRRVRQAGLNIFRAKLKESEIIHSRLSNDKRKHIEMCLVLRKPTLQNRNLLHSCFIK